MNKDALIRQTALESIKIESATISALESSINEDFCLIVQHIFHSDGRIVLTGIGKSALIAQKIVATFNSTGTPSLFMHAADAIHGDLGMIQKSDIVICLSKSGETPEIRVLVPLLKNLGNLLIGIVSREDSYLATHAHHIIYIPITKEADPNNLAPTASTTAQLVMGDALAMALLALRGFSSKDFAQFHPGGSLGKQLYLRMRDVYPQNQRPAVKLDTNIHDTLLEMTSNRLGCTAVLNENQKVVGIITDGDLRRMLERTQKNNLHELTAQNLMTSNPKTADADLLAVDALEIMRKYSITQLIIKKKEQYVGIVHLHDLIREGIL